MRAELSLGESLELKSAIALNTSNLDRSHGLKLDGQRLLDSCNDFAKNLNMKRIPDLHLNEYAAERRSGSRFA